MKKKPFCFLYLKKIFFLCQKPVHIIDISSSFLSPLYISRAPFVRTLNTRIFANRFFWILFIYLFKKKLDNIFYRSPPCFLRQWLLISFDSTLGWTFLFYLASIKGEGRKSGRQRNVTTLIWFYSTYYKIQQQICVKVE